MAKLPSYILDHCRDHCPKATKDWTGFYTQLEKEIQELNLKATLEERFQSFQFHHIPKIALAGCPNGCSRPQIKDIGVTGFMTPQLSGNDCSECQTCISVCQENAISWSEDGIAIDTQECISCGECIRSCPTERISAKESGWLLSLGGRLGRHPQFAKNVGQVRTGQEAKKWILSILQDYCNQGLTEERLSHYLERNKWVYEPSRS
ncbi:4Fe-4S dicluster domain-containing protein [Desulfitobacterium metallireducens]|uniref:Ferredoxin n=1 Tax=Desulfitobacterium metallireducens DSM 15288 TaxID=871968 RepID=W0ECX7_9FIRM|nr:4Fe-4S dicluster domain-containing protein [Desulfitobacterium metallireducens]AHF06931.1 dissimilatory sulfite reductase subunit alpha/beta [Desulfitobacterium metallireducens DSM 15288]